MLFAVLHMGWSKLHHYIWFYGNSALWIEAGETRFYACRICVEVPVCELLRPCHLRWVKVGVRVFVLYHQISWGFGVIKVFFTSLAPFDTLWFYQQGEWSLFQLLQDLFMAVIFRLCNERKYIYVTQGRLESRGDWNQGFELLFLKL